MQDGQSTSAKLVQCTDTSTQTEEDTEVQKQLEVIEQQEIKQAMAKLGITTEENDSDSEADSE